MGASALSRGTDKVKESLKPKWWSLCPLFPASKLPAPASRVEMRPFYSSTPPPQPFFFFLTAIELLRLLARGLLSGAEKTVRHTEATRPV